MKYRIEFPIKFDCNLRCFYCFHADYHNNRHPYTNGKRFERKFNLVQWEQWRSKFLADASEILIMFSGGEPFIPVNAHLCRELMEHCKGSIQSYEFLTNGLFNKEDVEFLKGLKNSIRRIGFTYHRKMIDDKPELVKMFYDNLLYIKSMGIPVYVKELLRVEDKYEIIRHRVYLRKNYGIELKIQDFKGNDRGLDCTEIMQYTEADCALVDMEYKHAVSQPCSCLRGYKGIAIRGYDEYSGNVIACWHDPVVVGNIQEMRFNPNFTVNILPDGTKDVTGVPKKYVGTNPKDLPIVNESNNIKQRGNVMSQWNENRINELRGELGAADEQIDKRRGEMERLRRETDERIGKIQNDLNRLQDTRLRIEGAITVLDEQLRAETAQSPQVLQAAPGKEKK